VDGWTVKDRAGREIYLTGERWQHIVSRHRVLAGHLGDVLSTLRLGHRWQDALQPFKYFYHRRCKTLPGYYDSITVVVLYQGDNRYVVTAWPEVEE
jgi:hypothetical protein